MNCINLGKWKLWQTIQSGPAWSGLVRPGPTRSDPVRFGPIWSDLIQSDPILRVLSQSKYPLPSPALGDLYVVHSDLRIWALALKKQFFQLFQTFSATTKKIIKAILCNFSKQLLKCFQKSFLNFFLPPKTWKKHPKKLLIIGPFFTVGPAA